VAAVEFRGGRLAEIRLHPVDLGLGTPERRRAGRPLLASGDTARAIIERFARMSARYGTKVELVSQPAPVGVISIATREV
jgi:poly-gamma-glutamate synthesis protein (capsule biosynthesis protein)